MTFIDIKSSVSGGAVSWWGKVTCCFPVYAFMICVWMLFYSCTTYLHYIAVDLTIQRARKFYSHCASISLHSSTHTSVMFQLCCTYVFFCCWQSGRGCENKRVGVWEKVYGRLWNKSGDLIHMHFPQPKCCALSKPIRLNGTCEIFFFTHPPLTFLSFVECQSGLLQLKVVFYDRSYLSKSDDSIEALETRIMMNWW